MKWSIEYLALFLVSWCCAIAIANPEYPYSEAYPKDTTTYSYTGTRTDALVGVLGGTGCSRHWDVLDAYDRNHHHPYDLCGTYSQVSQIHHKWVDLDKYWRVKKKIFAYPIKGDGVLERANCRLPYETFKLVQHEECGDAGHLIALCDRAGHDLTSQFSSACE